MANTRLVRRAVTVLAALAPIWACGGSAASKPDLGAAEPDATSPTQPDASTPPAPDRDAAPDAMAIGSPDGVGPDAATPPDALTATNPPKLTIEVMVGTDTAVSSKYGTGLEAFVQALFLHVNYMYRVFGDFGINVVMVRHEKDVDANGMTLSTDKDAMLANWTQWANAHNPASDADPSHFDFAVLLTQTSYGALGWAPVGPVMCTGSSAAVVSEEGYMTAKLVSHELGHVLGLAHEDNPDAVMHASPGTLWTDVAIATLKADLAKESSCLQDCVAPPQYTGIPTFTLNELCETRFALPPCATSQCDMLLCDQGGGICTYDQSPPLDGTSCGTDMWCIGGTCVARSSTAAVAGFDACAP